MTNQEFLNKSTSFKEFLEVNWDVFEYLPSFGNIKKSPPWDMWFDLERLYTSLIDTLGSRPNVVQLTYIRKKRPITPDMSERGLAVSSFIKSFLTDLDSLTPLQKKELTVDLVGLTQYIESGAAGVLSLHDAGFLSRHNWYPRMVVEFPKCGRTWLQFLISKYSVLISTQIPNTNTHSGALEITDVSPSIEWFPIIRRLVFLDRKVVYIVRDPRDVLVSWYFHSTRRERMIDSSILLTDFIRGEFTGISRLIKFYNIWQYVIANKIAPNLIIIRYEDMIKDITKEAQKVLQFWDVPIEGEKLKEAITMSSFSTMQSVEKTRGLKNLDDVYQELLPRHVLDPESYKVRRGVIGGYVDYLSPSDVSYLNSYIKDNLQNLVPEFQYVG